MPAAFVTAPPLEFVAEIIRLAWDESKDCVFVPPVTVLPTAFEAEAPTAAVEMLFDTPCDMIAFATSPELLTVPLLLAETVTVVAALAEP